VDHFQDLQAEKEMIENARDLGIEDWTFGTWIKSPNSVLFHLE
jgi:hypothetical protein